MCANCSELSLATGKFSHVMWVNYYMTSDSSEQQAHTHASFSHQQKGVICHGAAVREIERSFENLVVNKT